MFSYLAEYNPALSNLLSCSTLGSIFILTIPCFMYDSFILKFDIGISHLGLCYKIVLEYQLHVYFLFVVTYNPCIYVVSDRSQLNVLTTDYEHV